MVFPLANLNSVKPLLLGMGRNLWPLGMTRLRVWHCIQALISVFKWEQLWIQERYC